MARGGTRTILACAVALAVTALAAPLPAQAYWRHGWGGGWGGGWGWGGGFGVGLGLGLALPPPAYYPPPVYYAPPAYYPPPVVYAPPPPVTYYSQPVPDDDGGASYSAPAGAPNPSGAICYAGPYACPMDRALPAGSDCSCPGNSGRVSGRSG